MELVKRYLKAWLEPNDVSAEVPDYDSAKANFDELEKRIRTHGEWLNEMWDETDNRLTALEAKDAPEKLMICPDCHGYGRDIFRKCPTCHGLGKVNPIPTPTCGNCKKAWRKDGTYEIIGCAEHSGRIRLHGINEPACSKPASHYERREA